MLPLSKILKFNFIQYVNNSHKFKNIEHYTLSYKLVDAINDFDYTKIESILKNEIIINEFNYGSPKIIKDYSMSLVQCYIYNNYSESEKIVLDILNIENRDDIANFELSFHAEERYYSCIAHLSTLLCIQNEHSLSSDLLHNTINFIEKYYTDENLPSHSIDTYFKKLYTAILNNYADILFHQKKYDESYKFCCRAYNTVIKYNVLYALEYILKLKIEILCKLNRYDEAQIIYEDFKFICKLKNKIDYFNNTQKMLIENYPLIDLQK